MATPRSYSARPNSSGSPYAPRIKSLKRQTLYGFKSTSQEERKSWVVQPDKFVDEDMVRIHWDEILRLAVTIKLKKDHGVGHFPRGILIQKQNSLYTALKAFGRIVKTLFVLRYIDNVELRMAIEALLNKIELANRFTRAVAVGSPRDFIFALQEDQQVAEFLQSLDQERHPLLELPLSGDAPAGCRTRHAGRDDAGHQSALPAILGSRQHAGGSMISQRRS